MWSFASSIERDPVDKDGVFDKQTVLEGLPLAPAICPAEYEEGASAQEGQCCSLALVRCGHRQ